MLGEQIVMIQKIIIIADSNNSNQNGRDCVFSELFIINAKIIKLSKHEHSNNFTGKIKY